MSKGLEALTYFKTLFDIWKEKISVSEEMKENEEEYGFKPRYETIEKELKALEKIVELIKKMGYSLENLGNGCFCFSIDCFISINEQTFNLLEEVLL